MATRACEVRLIAHRKANGWCTRCGEPAAPFILCVFCREWRRTAPWRYTAQQMTRQRRRTRRTQEGQ